jgi:ubiquinone biosynthesis protein
MAGRIEQKRREEIEDFLLAAVQSDTEGMVDSVLRMGDIPASLDRDALQGDLNDFAGDYGEIEIDRIDMENLVRDFTGTIRRHRIVLPTSLLVLLRMLVVLEGSARILSPQFSIAEVLKPHMASAVKRRYAPARLMRKAQRMQREWQRLIETMPGELTEMLQRLRKGTLDIHLQHRRLDATFNRLIYGVLTASLILGTAQLLSSRVPPLVAGMSLPGLLCLIAAILLGLRLLGAIEGSGGLKKNDD